MQIPLFDIQSDWSPPKLSELPSWGNAKRVGIDIETCDPNLKTLGPGVRRGGFIAGVSFALDGGPAFYLPIQHQLGNNLDIIQVFNYLMEQSKLFKGELCGANLGYDLDFLAEEKIVFRNVSNFRDVMIADPLLYELHRSYSLDAIAKRHGFDGKDETLLREAAQNYKVDPKKDLWRLPPKFVGPYAEEDARLPLRILEKQEKLLKQKDLWGIYTLESELLPVLVKMRRRGVLIDLDKLSHIEDWSKNEENVALQEIKRLTGVDIGIGNVWKADAIAPALHQIGFNVPLTPKTQKPSISKETLSSIDHKIAKLILRAREVNKLRTTFAQSIRNHITNGRIHCVFNQMARDDGEGGVKGARFGRMSSEHPNLQQQPSRGEFAAMWRSIYIPEPGLIWNCNDYSQQEPRMTTHFAEAIGCKKSHAAAEKYRVDPNTDNHDMMTRIIYGDEVNTWSKSVYKQKRSECKDIYLGLCYGMGGAKLARELGLETEWIELKNGDMIEVAGKEAKYLFNRFDAEAPFVRELADKVKKVAGTRGFIKTILGRRCHFPKSESGGYDWIHKALNRLIQGSSADQTKKALVEVDKAGYRVQLQVHDELDQSVESKKEAEEIAEIMRHCVKLSVPSKVDVELGPNWGEIS